MSMNPSNTYAGIPSKGIASTGTTAVDPKTGQNIPGTSTPGSGLSQEDQLGFLQLFSGLNKAAQQNQGNANAGSIQY